MYIFNKYRTPLNLKVLNLLFGGNTNAGGTSHLTLLVLFFYYSSKTNYSRKRSVDSSSLVNFIHCSCKQTLVSVVELDFVMAIPYNI